MSKYFGGTSLKAPLLKGKSLFAAATHSGSIPVLFTDKYMENISEGKCLIVHERGALHSH